MPLYHSDFQTELHKAELFRRVDHARNICSSNLDDKFWKDLQPTGHIWVYKPLRVYYCITPKAGCTYWKRVLRFLSGDFPKDKNVQAPSDIDRDYVHYGKIENLNQRPMTHPVIRTLMSAGNSFMVARNPYSRLWSAYIDKLFLPDFWRTDAKYIVKRQRPNATEFEKQCPRDVSFQEFLTSITQQYPHNLNEHWQPVVKQCSPCHANFAYILKQETFSDDVDVVLDQLGLNFMKLKQTVPLKYHQLEEIKMLTSYNFRLQNVYPKDCFELEDVAKRLWKTFQYNGYIHRDLDIPLADMRKENFTTNSEEVFIKYAMMTLQYQNDQHIDLQEQKRNMMLEAYKAIPVTNMAGIALVYEHDFEMFGYERTLNYG